MAEGEAVDGEAGAAAGFALIFRRLVGTADGADTEARAELGDGLRSEGKRRERASRGEAGHVGAGS